MKEYEILEDCALHKAKVCLIAQPQKPEHLILLDYI